MEARPRHCWLGDPGAGPPDGARPAGEDRDARAERSSPGRGRRHRDGGAARGMRGGWPTGPDVAMRATGRRPGGPGATPGVVGGAGEVPVLTTSGGPAEPATDGPSPSVDVVVPVYNEAHVLAASIARLHGYLTDRFPFPWRITIADNASTDGTWDVASRRPAAAGGAAAVGSLGRDRRLPALTPVDGGARCGRCRPGRARCRHRSCEVGDVQAVRADGAGHVPSRDARWVTVRSAVELLGPAAVFEDELLGPGDDRGVAVDLVLPDRDVLRHALAERIDGPASLLVTDGPG